MKEPASVPFQSLGIRIPPCGCACVRACRGHECIVTLESSAPSLHSFSARSKRRAFFGFGQAHITIKRAWRPPRFRPGAALTSPDMEVPTPIADVPVNGQGVERGAPRLTKQRHHYRTWNHALMTLDGMAREPVHPRRTTTMDTLVVFTNSRTQ